MNLSPFSFFNAFGSNPPILIFSPARRVRDNTTKHTLENARKTMEVVINVVNHAIVEQVSLSSCEYDKEINEFLKAGLTPVSSMLVKPPRVAESPVQFECKVLNIVETGEEGGAGNLIICQILKMHINKQILDSKGLIDQHKIDLVARLGGDWYCRASGDALFQVPKPNQQKGIGFDQIPTSVLNSHLLTGNELGRLANIAALPGTEDVVQFKQSTWFRKQAFSESLSEGEKQQLFEGGKLFLHENLLHEAWCCFLISI
jgi:flavin reductase (DIM6/NTAB) family NADH-FMN oxidoreductase RutF